MNLKTYNINGFSSYIKSIENKSSNKNSPLVNKTLMSNFEEEKTKIYLPTTYLGYNYIKSSQNLTHENILCDKISDKIISYNNLDEMKKQKRKNSNETLENGLNLDEQNLKEYYEKIEKELNKLKKDKKDNKIKNIEETNQNIKNNNTIKNKSSFNTNSQFDEDLFYYSEEEDIIKKKKEMKDNINFLKNNLYIDLNQNLDNNKNNNTKIEIKIDEQIKKNNFSSIIDDIKIDKDLLDKIEYGIDENGNPIDIKNYNEEINNERNNIDEDNKNFSNNKTNKIKKPVAYIIQKEEKGSNYLIDLKGNKIQKTEDGYFNYKNDNIRLLIKDFDVQHPELRVFGTRKRDTLLLNDEEENINIHKSLEIKELIIPNSLKNKLLNRNSSYNITEKKNITTDDCREQKKIFLNKSLLCLKKYTPIIIKESLEKIKKDNKDNQFRIWKTNENLKTENREIYSYNTNKKEKFCRKIPLKNFNDDLSINNILNNRSSETIIRTNKILNKSVNGEIYIRRDNFYNPRLGKKKLKKRNLNKSDYTKKSSNNISLFNDSKVGSINSFQEIKNMTCTTSRINLYKYKKINKRAGSYSCNYNRIFNLNNTMNRNTEVNKSNELLDYIQKKEKNKNKNVNKKKNNNNQLYNYKIENKNNENKIICNNNIKNDKEIIYNNESKNNNDNQILYYEKENNRKNNSISYNNESYNDSKIKSYKSTGNITSTIDSISHNNNYIQNNIRQNLIKFNNKNENISANTSNNEIIKKSVPLSVISPINSQSNSPKEFTSCSNIYYLNNKPKKKNINNKSIDNNNSNYLLKISKNKKHKISPIPNRKFHCAILSKEVNDIISNYSNKNKENENININNNEYKKMDIYEDKNKIKIKDKNINSFLCKTKNKINSNYINNITQKPNYKTRLNNSSFNLEDNKQKIINNKKMDDCKLSGCNVLKKLKDKQKNIIIKNETNNFTQIIKGKEDFVQKKSQIQNKFNINRKILNTITEPKCNYRKMNNKKKINNKSNSIASLSEINFNSQRMTEQYNNNKYSENAFKKNNKFNNSYFLLKNKNYIYNYTERDNYNNNNKII